MVAGVLRRWLLRRAARRAGPYLRAHGLLATVKHHPALLWEPGAERVLVLAPHMDDEVIGCGGTLHRHVLAGAEVTVVYVADGASGSKAVRDLRGDTLRVRSRALVETRKAEARRALEVLGVAGAVFLDAPDWAVAGASGLGEDLRRELERARPEIVYVPSFLEEHPDHRALTPLLLDAAGPAGAFRCCAYEVWTPLFPNAFVDIGAVLDVKRRALEEYRTQLADNDYVSAALGLNAYRAMFLSRAEPSWAEAFLLTPIADYRRLWARYRGKP